MRSCGSKRSQDSKERKNQKKGDKVTARFKQLRKNIYSGSLFFNHQIKREGLIKCARYQTASRFVSSQLFLVVHSRMKGKRVNEVWMRKEYILTTIRFLFSMHFEFLWVLTNSLGLLNARGWSCHCGESRNQSKS